MYSRRGSSVAAATARWVGPLSPEDHRVLELAVPPVLDVGCGPGRHVLALAERGALALGIDITPAALAVARRRGAPVLERSVFDRVPGAGRWASALLLDGNLGIGGDAVALLARVASLLRPRGIVLVEVESPGDRSERDTVRLELGEVSGPWFEWSPVSADELQAVAGAAGLGVDELWRDGRCWFGILRRA